MRVKDLKINFRYLGGNIACLSVDSIDGKSVHNDINNEEAIIIFNSLVGEKEDCQTVKSLLKENAELKEQIEEKQNPLKGIFAQVNDDMLLRNCGAMQSEIDTYKNKQKEFIKWLENGIEKVKNTEFLDERIQRAGLIAYNRCLQKYKSIIGDDK